MNSKISTNADSLNLLDIISINLFIEQNTSTTVHRNPSIKWWTDKYFNKKRNLFRQYLSCLKTTPLIITNIPYTSNSDAYFSNAPWQKLCKKTNHTDIKQLLYYYTIDEQTSIGFDNICLPLFASALEKIDSTLNCSFTIESTINKPKILSDFIFYLRQRISHVLTPAFILEANLARLNTLTDQPPEQRFQQFIDSLALEKNRKAFWKKYPTLWRLISNITANTIHSCASTIKRIATDQDDISAFLKTKQKIILNSIHWGLGDSHRGGQVVAIIDFGCQQLIYKPRPVKTECAFNAFLIWFSSTNPKMNIPTYSVLDKESYGYVEYIKPQECTSHAEASLFYKRLGILIAIAWLLGIHDLHYENLIASGNTPYLIDLEAMFGRAYPQMKKHKCFADYYSQAFTNLLFRTSLLPIRRIGLFGVFDSSAIGARSDQAAPAQVQMLTNIGRDDIGFTEKHASWNAMKNIPILNGQELVPLDYIDSITSGYQEAISTLQKNKKYLSSHESIIFSFLEIPIRHIARTTQIYGDILSRMVHPAFLTQALECDMFIGGNLFNQIEFSPHLKIIIKSEVKDIWNGDVPYFWTTPKSLDLFDADGNIYYNYFNENSSKGLQQRLNSLNKNITPQLEAIRLSIISTCNQQPHTSKKEQPFKLSVKNSTTDYDLIVLAKQIGNELQQKAHYENHRPFWVGLTSLDDKNFTASVLQPSLYEGTPGIGVFFCYLYKTTNDPSFKKIAFNSLKFVRSLLKDPTAHTNCGAFSGVSGLLYADMLMSSALNIPIISNKHALNTLKHLIQQDINYDIMSGTAGALLILLRYFTKTKDPLSINVATIAAEHLYSAAEHHTNGQAWHTLKAFQQRLGGLSHGVSGIAWALSEWFLHTNEQKWQTLAESAFRYEQSLFNKEAENWSDLRYNNSTCAWCHGAPGIGIATNSLKIILNKAECDHTLAASQKSTLKYGISNNHCLCHGNMGNAEFFKATHDLETANNIIQNIVEDYKSLGYWRLGFPHNTESPSLMTGLSGIGYGLLRHAFPHKLPNILSLECPQ
jgi:type 2 lantibiotic biosynthesis protein LanM